MKIRRGKIILVGILLLIFVFIAISVAENRQLIGLIALPTQKYQPTKIPVDTTDLFEYDRYIKNEVAYIYVQGGPNWELFNRKLSPLNGIPHIGTFIRVFPYQSQILNHSILAAMPPLTAEQAQQEVKVSAEILYRTIAYYKNMGKKVYVFCISHGSQIGLEMLRNHGNISDGLALTMIRLDLDEEAINLSNDGKVPYYNANQELTSRYFNTHIFAISTIKQQDK